MKREALAHTAQAFVTAGNPFDPVRAVAFAEAITSPTSTAALIFAQGALAALGIRQEQTEQLLPLVDDLAQLIAVDVSEVAKHVRQCILTGRGSLDRYGVRLDDEAAFAVCGEPERIAIVVGLLERKVGGVAKRLASDTIYGAGRAARDARSDLLDGVAHLVGSVRRLFRGRP